MTENGASRAGGPCEARPDDRSTTKVDRSGTNSPSLNPLQSPTAVRERLPTRPASEASQFQHGGVHYTATISYFPGTNRLAEIFLGNGREGSDVDAAAKDSAVVASIALQHSVSVGTIRRALLRDPRGVASSPLGVALDLIADMQP